MTDTEGSGAPASVPGLPYDPKAIFFEEWGRVVPAWLKADPAIAWGGLGESSAERRTGRVIAQIPIDLFRLMSRGAAHGWAAQELATMAEGHRKQSSAARRIIAYDVEHAAGKDVCATLDLEGGLIRECVHVHKDAEAAGDFPILEMKMGDAKSLIELLKKAGVLGGA